MAINVCVVLGSVREGRLGERVARMIMKNLETIGAKPPLLDPLVITPPLLQQPIQYMKDPSQAPQWMQDIHQVIKDCQGFVIVTAEYNCCLPPALTNLLDHFPPASYRHKPVSIASYSKGSGGGIRAAAIARPFLAELGMVSLPSLLTVPNVLTSGIAENGETVDNERIVRNTENMCKELVWYALAIKNQTDKTGSVPVGSVLSYN